MTAPDLRRLDELTEIGIAVMVAAQRMAMPMGYLPNFDRMPSRHHKAPAPKPDKRAKVKAARAQNVNRNRK